MKTQIVETSYGEVKVKWYEDDDYSECYIGDNWDDFIGEIPCTPDMSYTGEVVEEIEKLLNS